jgi:hypothetical protein
MREEEDSMIEGASKEQASSSEKQTPEKKPSETTPESLPTTKGVTRIVYVPARKGQGWILPGQGGQPATKRQVEKKENPSRTGNG